MEYSKNELAADIVGFRWANEGANVGALMIPLDLPAELGFHCPICQYESSHAGEFDTRLDWSEYNGFIYCHTCNKDYPSALCQPDIDRAIEIYLTCVKNAINNKH